MPNEYNEARLMRIIEGLAGRPDKGLPEIMRNASQLEGTYRFINNEHIEAKTLFAAHAAETLQRTAKAKHVVVAHDSSAMLFGGERKGLGRMSGKQRGFLLHVALAVDATTSMPLGVLHSESLVREDKVKARHRAVPDDETNEALRWNRAAMAVHEALPNAVHVMDREADSYSLLEEMLGRGQDFVVRLSHRERRAEGGAIGKLVTTAPVKAEREVWLSPRGEQPGSPQKHRYPARRGRQAKLEVSAYRRAEVLRPQSCGADYSPRFVVNVVRVLEKHAPAGQQPVEWLLYTSLPVETPEQTLTVVDAYRQRWLIEEFFKALKTGCAYEKRQLESMHALLVMLSLSIPIAWHLLRMRTLFRVDPQAPASSILTPSQIDCLRHELGKRALPERPTVRDALLAVASLGGHLKNNGDPGWLTIARGFHDLQLLERGYLFEQTKGDQS